MSAQRVLGLMVGVGQLPNDLAKHRQYARCVPAIPLSTLIAIYLSDEEYSSLPYHCETHMPCRLYAEFQIAARQIDLMSCGTGVVYNVWPHSTTAILIAGMVRMIMMI
jgi:hypothetical protein